MAKSISLDEIQILNKYSNLALVWLKEKFPNIELSINNPLSIEFPVRWKVKLSGKYFEWVVSDLGSITLRLSEISANRKNPAPIFYLSLGKNETGEFVWLDLDGEKVDFPNEEIINTIQKRVEFYLHTL